ncbi:Uncharacterized protein PHSC3_001049 [Chlamydiales bacterium STE3]|nr:Uncharacterized protein PHSC3_001049 [Chlamydiales bacterium STE3]
MKRLKMSRFTFALTIALIVLFGFLAVNSMKNSYKILPINAAKAVDQVPFSDWHRFVSTEDQFAVKLPVIPQHATQSIRDPLTNKPRIYDMYVAQKEDGTIFMISLIKFPEVIQASNDVLQKTIINDMIASNPKNQLKDIKVSNYHNHKASDFKIENEEHIVIGKTFVNGKTLILLSTIFNHNAMNEQEYEFFVNSFELEPSQPTPEDE